MKKYCYIYYTLINKICKYTKKTTSQIYMSIFRIGTVKEAVAISAWSG